MNNLPCVAFLLSSFGFFYLGHPVAGGFSLFVSFLCARWNA